MLGGKHYDGKKISLPISDDAELDLLEHWTMQAVSSFMSAFATRTATKLPKEERRVFTKCTKEADGIIKHAKCVMRAIEASKKNKDSSMDYENEDTPPTGPTALEQAFVTEAYSTTSNPIHTEKIKRFELLKETFRKLHEKSDEGHGEPFRRRMRDEVERDDLEQDWRPIRKGLQKPNTVDEGHQVVKQDNYQLMTDNENHSPFGILMKYFTRAIRVIKHKTRDKSWKTDMMLIRQLAKEIQEKEDEQSKNAKLLQARYSSPVKSKHPKNDDDEWMKRILDDLPPSLRQKFEEYKLTKGIKDPLGTSMLVRKAVKLAMSLTGQNTTNFDKKTVKLASPRFFSIVPDEDTDDIRLLSPSLFSLHEDGKDGEKQFSLSNLLKSTNVMDIQDQDEIVNLIAEATGVADAVEDAHKMNSLKNETNLKKIRGIDGQPMYFTKENATEIYGEIGKKKIEAFERLHGSLTNAQLKEMNATGFSMLNPEQLEMLYGKDSPYASKESLDKFSNLTYGDELYELIEHDISLFKDAPSVSLSLKKQKRHKRQVTLSPLLFANLVLAPGTLSQAIVLSPVLFSPVVLSPAVLGPFILSPWLFIPVILSPRVLSPLILNPLLFSPVILSPLVLHPFILSPGIFNSFVLSPLVLAPFILSPQVGTPLILSPFVLSPLILNPMAMSPLVLSPFVLSPIVLSPQHIFALVLSPHALSPLVESKLSMSTVIASPSVLS